MAKPTQEHCDIQDHLSNFLNKKLNSLNEPLSTSQYEIYASIERALGLNGHGLVPDVMLARFYKIVNHIEATPPTPYIIIEIEKFRIMSKKRKKTFFMQTNMNLSSFKGKLKKALEKLKNYLDSYPNNPEIPHLEVFLFDYINHIWFTCDRNGNVFFSSFSNLLNDDLDKGV